MNKTKISGKSAVYINKHEQKERNIYIKGAPRDVKNDLVIIAKNQGISLSYLLKSHLRAIRDSYPESMRIKRED